MEQNFSSTKLPTSASQSPSIDGVSWANPTSITADDGSSATLAFSTGGDSGAIITGSIFDFQQLPTSAVIDGIEVYIDGSQTSCEGTVDLNISGAVAKDFGVLNGTYGSSTDLWGLDVIDPADIASITVSIDAGDISGGDGVASIDYLSITIYWHIEVTALPADVPTRIAYKVYSRAGTYLGDLPNVVSKLAFAQDINSAGTTITVLCAENVKNEVTVSPLLTEAGDIITTEDDLPILATSTDLLVTTGASPDEAIFKNSNRVKVWVYNQYYPNGKLEFSGQINKVALKYVSGSAVVALTIYSDGIDLNNYVARGYPFTYTTDVSQTTATSFVSIFEAIGGPSGSYTRAGQVWKTGVGVTNIGSVSLLLQGTANVTVSIYDAPNGNLLGSVTKAVAAAVFAVNTFDFPALINLTAETEYFLAVSVAPGENIVARRSTSSVYADGSMYIAIYSGGSGGGSYVESTYDMYFVTKSGLPTTTTTYSTDDPVTDMGRGILLDYNSRGGLITERDFEASGLSLTYTFVQAFIYNAFKKIIEMCPTGFYFYVDVGTSEMDIKNTSTTADYTVVRGRHINSLDLVLSIEQVKNYLLFSGGDTGGGVNLYQDYTDAVSISNYGIRSEPKADDRVTLSATADAIGSTFIEENSEETQETSLVVTNDHMDITQLVPGKTIGFKNFGNFIDDMVLQIVRREPDHSDGIVRLTLGRLPIRMNDQIQQINRSLLDTQTIDNPASPS